MSRSKRKPIIKDKPRRYKASTYYRRVRRVVNQAVKSFKEIIPESKEIVNDYDYCDYIIDYENDGASKWWKNGNNEQDENKIKYSRK